MGFSGYGGFFICNLELFVSLFPVIFVFGIEGGRQYVLFGRLMFEKVRFGFSLVRVVGCGVLGSIFCSGFVWALLF